jgi:hypothetical protein
MDMRKLLESVAKFAGEPEQKPGEQWKGTDSAPPGKKLVGDSIIKDLAKGPTPKTKEQELAEAYAKFLEDNIGVEPKRPSRKGSRPARDMGKTGEPSKRYNKVSEGWGRGNDRVTLPDDSTLYWSGNGPLQQEYDALYNELVPSQGKADTIEGEVLRAASKIVYRHYNDGDEFNQASFEQLVPYIGAVTSYDDLAHKSTEFAMKANGNYTPNPNWDSLDVMEYGPEEDDYDDEEDDDWNDEYEDPNEEEDDEDLEEARTTWNSDWYVYNPETLAVKKKFRTYKGAKQYAEANGLKLAASEWYHDKINTQKQTDEGIGSSIKKAVKSVKRGVQGWDKGYTQDNPRDLVKRNKAYSDKEISVLRGDPTISTEVPHSPAALQRKVLDREAKKRGMEEGWESGPEERSSRERDPDAEYDDMRQQRADDEAQAAQAKRPQKKYYTLSGRGPNQEPNYEFPGEYATQDEADKARARLMADPKTPNPRDIGIRSRTKYLDESIESADPVEGAVLSAVQELIQQGHTEVAPEVITNMVVAATSQPFLLKDLVDANKNSSAIQHYVDSINPTKVKFSSDILTVKNENPAKKSKEQAQTGVANMAARAAGRNRLGEASTPLRDREDYDAKNKALQDIQMDPSTSQDPQLSAELARRKAELVQQAKQLGISESRAHKLIANKLKQMELQRQMGSPEGDAAYSQHVDSLKKSKEEYLKKTPNTIYKREVDEAGSAVGGGAVGGTSDTGTIAVNPETVKQTTSALNTFKSATGSNAPAPNIAKALDAVTQGTSVGSSDMKILEPVMKDLATVATDPKLASQFKSLAGQVNQTQAKQQ